MKKESEIMKTTESGKFSYLLLGIGLGAIGSVLLARKETRDLLRERSKKSLEYLNQRAAKLRETAEEIVLALPGGATTKLPKSGIAKREKLPNSMMPSGLNQALSKDDLVDLVEYLASLKKL